MTTEDFHLAIFVAIAAFVLVVVVINSAGRGE